MVTAHRATILVGLIAALAGGCKRGKKAAPTATTPVDAAAARCPDTAGLAKVLGEPVALLRSGCFPFPYGSYWMAGVVRHDPKGTAAPSVRLVAGGLTPAVTVYDVKAAPAAALAALAKGSDALDVTLRLTRQSLVRLGIAGRAGGSSEEIAMVFQLVAHAPPRLVWVGAGDQVTAGADGCLEEKRVTFDTLFGNRLEIYVNHSARRAPGKSGPPCPAAGLGAQESIKMNPVPLEAGRRVGG